MKGMWLKVDSTVRDSSGSLRKTRVTPFEREKTSITKPSRRMWERVMVRGRVSGVDAKRGLGEVKLGVEVSEV